MLIVFYNLLRPLYFLSVEPSSPRYGRLHDGFYNPQTGSPPRLDRLPLCQDRPAMDFATRDARLRQADFDQVSPLAAPAGWRSRLWQSCPVTPVTFDVGAKWSNDLKEYAGTHSCQLPHVALVLSGTLRVVMDAGSRQDFSKNDVMLLPVWTAATPQHRPLLGHFFDVNRDE
jgi:hypothetical protein